MQERNRLKTKFIERFRNAENETAVMYHLLSFWTSTIKPTFEDMSTVGEVVSNMYSDDDDYLVVTPDALVLVGEHASVTYGEFDGFSSGNRTKKQIIDGLTRVKDYTIYKINRQFIEQPKDRRPICTLLDVDHVDLAKRLVCTDKYGFKMDEIELDRDSNQFIVKELIFDGLQYRTKSGMFVKDIIPRKVIDESNSSIPRVNSEELHESSEQSGQGTTEDSDQ